MFNPVAKRIGNVMDEAVKKEQARKKAAQPVQKPMRHSDALSPASKDPAMIAANAEAKKRSDAYLAQKAAENVVPKITRKK